MVTKGVETLLKFCVGTFSRTVISTGTLSLLIGCGGGGGSASPPATTSYSATGDANSVTVVLSSGSVTGFGTVNVSNTASQGATVLDSDGSVTKFNLSNASGSVSFDKSAGDTIVTTTVGGVTIVGAENTVAQASVVDLGESGIGVYMATSDGINGFGATTYYGYPNSITTFNPTGSATYTGGAIGLYGATGSAPILTTASMTAAANFTTDTISLSTTGTEGFNTATGASLGAYATLDITASNLTDPDGDNKFIGNISNGAGFTGNAEIALFGSAAQEASGIGSVTDNNAAPTKVHLIAFGSNK
jgi:hypothetical protein